MRDREIFKCLAKAGFDIGQALEICAQDTELYKEVLKTALEEGRRKYGILVKSLEEGDYERYHVEVHGLKNSARAIGAMELSRLSLEQERAAKEGDLEALAQGGGKLLKTYAEAIRLLGELLD